MPPRPCVAAVMGLLAAALGGPARADDAAVARAMTAALPAADRTDLVLVDLPATTGAPRVRAVTHVAAAPAAILAALRDPAHYRALIPSLVRTDVQRDATGTLLVDWEIEVPLFNLKGRLAVHTWADGVRLDLFDGDFSPGHLMFTTAPSGAGALLSVDTSLDVRRSNWLLRRLMKHSPFGEPAALAAATYVALRAVALRAEHPGVPFAWRPNAPFAPPPAWTPDPAPLARPQLAALRALGIVALVAREPTERLAGVVAAAPVPLPRAALTAALRRPSVWALFPGWHEVAVQPGPSGDGARVTDDLPLVDLDATYAAAAAARWVAVSGATRGARLGWDVFGDGDGAIAALSLYPRLESTGSIARRFIAAEPLLESGLALTLAFADAASVQRGVDGAR